MPRIALALVCAIVFRGLPRAQGLSTAELLAPVGSSFHHYQIADLFPWDTLQGPGVLWDYAWTDVDSTDDVTFLVIEPDEAPALPDHPTANRVIRSIQGDNDDYIIDRFYEVQVDRVSEVGSAGPVLTYAFDDPELAYGLPMQLGDTLWDDYCFWSDGLGVQYHFCGSGYVTHDATGTLILPYGTFTDVKHVTQWHTSIETTGPGEDTTRFHRQQWFAPGIAFPILEVRLTTYANGSHFVGGSLLDGDAFAAIRDTEAHAWSAFPNPTAGALTLQRASGGAAWIDVLAPDGRVMLADSFRAGDTQRSLALHALPAGIYVVRVSDEAGSTAQRIIKGD
jgi:hypothetical protein